MVVFAALWLAQDLPCSPVTHHALAASRVESGPSLPRQKLTSGTPGLYSHSSMATFPYDLLELLHCPDYHCLYLTPAQAGMGGRGEPILDTTLRFQPETSPEGDTW